MLFIFINFINFWRALFGENLYSVGEGSNSGKRSVLKCVVCEKVLIFMLFLFIHYIFFIVLFLEKISINYACVKISLLKYGRNQQKSQMKGKPESGFFYIWHIKQTDVPNKQLLYLLYFQWHFITQYRAGLLYNI